METDPELQPREANNIVAADVVGNNLVLRRYDGTEEVVSLGGFLDSQLLQWYVKATALGAGANAPGVTQTAALYSVDGQTDLQDLELEDLDNNGVEMGDDYILSTDETNYRLWFKTLGLYVVNVTLDQAVSDLTAVLSVSGGSSKGGAIKASTDATTYGQGQLMIAVGVADISEVGSLDSGEVLDVVMYNNSDGPHDVTAQLSITKVM